MTRRERLTARADRRETWAEGRSAKAATAHEAARLDEAKTGIPFGQPILVGHHSERRHRRVVDRASAAMGRAVEHGAKAREHAAAAETIRARLESSIYSDDADAIEALEARAAASDAEAERNARINAAWRKAIGKVDARGRIPALNVAAGMRAIAAIVGATEAAAICRVADVCPASMISRQIVSTTSPRAAARRDRERIAQIKHDAERRAEGAAAVARAGGPALVDLPDGWARMTFPERPARAVLTALKAAGWFFRAGSWHGRRSTLPADVAALASVVEAPPAPEPAPADDGGPDYIVTVSDGLPACVIDGKRTRLVAAMRAAKGRNPAVELIDCAAPSAPPVWSGPLADWLERIDPLDLLAWDDAAWIRVRDLSMGRGVVLYLGDAPSHARVAGTCAALQLARKGAA